MYYIGISLEDLTGTHLRADKLGGTTGEWNRLGNPGSVQGEIKPQNL